MFEYGNVIGRFAVLKRKRAFYASRGIFSRRQNSTLQHSKDDQNIDASIDRTQERIAFTAVAAEFAFAQTSQARYQCNQNPLNRRFNRAPSRTQADLHISTAVTDQETLA